MQTKFDLENSPIIFPKRNWQVNNKVKNEINDYRQFC